MKTVFEELLQIRLKCQVGFEKLQSVEGGLEDIKSNLWEDGDFGHKLGLLWSLTLWVPHWWWRGWVTGRRPTITGSSVPATIVLTKNNYWFVLFIIRKTRRVSAICWWPRYEQIQSTTRAANALSDAVGTF